MFIKCCLQYLASLFSILIGYLWHYMKVPITLENIHQQKYTKNQILLYVLILILHCLSTRTFWYLLFIMETRSPAIKAVLFQSVPEFDLSDWRSFNPVHFRFGQRGAYHNSIGRMHQCSQLIEIILSLRQNKGG